MDYICIMYLLLIIKHFVFMILQLKPFNNGNMTWEAVHYIHLTGVKGGFS